MNVPTVDPSQHTSSLRCPNCELSLYPKEFISEENERLAVPYFEFSISVPFSLRWSKPINMCPNFLCSFMCFFFRMTCTSCTNPLFRRGPYWYSRSWPEEQTLFEPHHRNEWTLFESPFPVSMWPKVTSGFVIRCFQSVLVPHLVPREGSDRSYWIKGLMIASGIFFIPAGSEIGTKYSDIYQPNYLLYVEATYGYQW